jgi:hypothetical protein
MNQDVWIYNEIVGLDLHVSDEMKGHILSCGTSVDLNDGVEDLWSECLERAYQHRPGDDQIDRWHAFFAKLVDLAEVGRRIPVFGRHMASGAFAYPELKEVDRSYIDINVPASDQVKNTADPDSADYQQPKDKGEKMPFKSIFDKTIAHINEAWGILAEDMFANSQSLGVRHTTVFGDWSLDTGIDKATGNLLLWPLDKKLLKT